MEKKSLNLSPGLKIGMPKKNQANGNFHLIMENSKLGILDYKTTVVQSHLETLK